MGEKDKSGNVELREILPTIKTSDDLAVSLGYEKVLNEGAKWLRIYQKRLDTDTYLHLLIQDGKPGMGEIGERITVVVGRHQEMSNFDLSIDLCQSPNDELSKSLAKLRESLTPSRMFDKAELKKYGYQHIYKVLSEMENRGGFNSELLKWESRLREMGRAPVE